MRFKINILVFLMFFPILVFGQKGYRFYSFTEKDGLSNNIITNIVEDGNGFMWIGSYSGLMKYDGYGFTLINSGSDSLSLKGTFISDLATDGDGNIWVSSESGICKYDISKERFYSYTLKADGKVCHNYQADKVFVLKDGRVLFFAKRLYELDEKENCFRPVMDSLILSHKIINCFDLKSGGFLLVSSEEKTIFYVDNLGNVITEISDGCTCESNPYERPYAVLEISENKFYIGGVNGLYLIDVSTKKVEKITEIFGVKMPTQIASLFMDKSGNVWLGSNGEDLYVLPKGGEKPFRIESDVNHSSVEKLNSFTTLTMYTDSRGLMWFGTWNGLAYTNLEKENVFNNFAYPESSGILSSNFVSSFAERKDGLLAIGTDGGGIVFWDKKSAYRQEAKSPEKNNKMPNHSVLALAFDSQGNLYDGGYKHPLHKFSSDGVSDEVFKFDPSDSSALESDFIRALYMENDTTLWVLTNGAGLSLFNTVTKKFKGIKCDKNGVQPCSPYGICMTEDKDGLIIVGTYNGLFTYDKKENVIKNYVNDGLPGSLSHNWVYSVFTDSKQRLWAGTISGLNLLDKTTGTFKVFAQNEGFINSVCSSIAEDKDGFLWIATAKGIVKFSPEEGRVVRNFDKDNGLFTDNFTQCACLKDKTGTIFLGTNAGMISFNPDKIRVDNYVPEPLITALLINYAPVRPCTENSPLKESVIKTKEITLTSSQSTFSLQFAALGYAGAYSYLYAYRIKDYDKDWNYIDKRREIDFTQLSPGRYEIDILAINQDGVRSNVKTLIVNILPPWYKTWTALCFFFLIIALSFYLWHHWRVRKLKEQKEYLENEVQLRTQAIRGSITCAQTIQTALLANETDFYKYFETSCVYRPKDIVSGDFFWLKSIVSGDTEMLFVSLVDCTGHGVPGAFMSLIANVVLSEIVEIKHIYSTEEILSELSYGISVMLKQDCSDNKDGMDMTLCKLERKKDGVFSLLQFSSAKNYLYFRHKDDTEYQVIKGDRKSVAGGVRHGGSIERKTFLRQEFEVFAGDVIYMASDGISDMCDIARKRFSRERFKQLLNDIYPLEMDCQAAELEKTISAYTFGTEQRDDISVLGLKIK
ncbi:MAG: SpoIIE family protein phosphatase [Bacteroidales bacterium]|nr:SpoIIE family protein phosphatase [Bacteroidales bacterium]